MINEAALATAAKVEEYLRELGSAFSKVGDTTFFAKRGSTVVAIRIEAWQDVDAMVHLEAPVVEGAELSAELLKQLLEYNHGSVYGNFGLDGEGVVTYHHCLLGGPTLDKRELLPAVLEVAKVADDWDDVIIDQAGGKTAIDRLREHIESRPADEKRGDQE